VPFNNRAAVLIFKTCYCAARKLGVEKSSERNKRRAREEKRGEKWALVAWL
jgi:hypothetical protein